MSKKRKYPCPCCGNYTYDQPAKDSYDICSVCYWEDDPIQLLDPDYDGGANIPSLNQARENYRRIGAYYESALPHVRPPKPSELPENN